VRFVVDQCVPVEVARWLSSDGHEAWTAYEAGLDDARDEDLIAYAHAKRAALVTTNRDCAQLARRLRSARVIWLAVREPDARAAVERAVAWIGQHALPQGRVLKIGKTAEPQVVNPLPHS
jgi:predicted nuclease of predicted toxin-antitoxin system